MEKASPGEHNFLGNAVSRRCTGKQLKQFPCSETVWFCLLDFLEIMNAASRGIHGNKV